MPRFTDRVAHLAAVAAGALILAAVPAVVGPAAAAPPTRDDDKVSNCNGIRPTVSSDTTIKDIVGGSLNPGDPGGVTFLISFPVTPDEDSDDTFVIEDCFGVVDENRRMNPVIDAFEEPVVDNDAFFEFQYTLQIPDEVPIGALLCNWVKVTADPSAGPGGNRKGELCFYAGGSARVEKHDENGDPLWGAKFNVSCEDDEAVHPEAFVSGLFADADSTANPVSGNDVTGYLNEVEGAENAISINGEAGAECTVTELQAPEGYLTPVGDAAVHTITIPRGGQAAVELAIVNEPVVPTYDAVTTSTTPSGTFDRTTSWALAKTVDDAAHSGDVGEEAGSSSWSVTATKTVSAPSNYTLTNQTVTVSNPNPVPVVGTMAVTVGGAAVVVDCVPATDGAQDTMTVPAKSGDIDGSASCTYGGAASGAADQVVATFSSSTPGVDGDSVTSDVSWTPNDLGPQSLSVDDDRAPSSVLPETVTGSKTWTYSETFDCPSDQTLYDEDGRYTQVVTNTATATGLPSSSASVTVDCSLVEVLSLIHI